jgi:hypothetical protein
MLIMMMEMLVVPESTVLVQGYGRNSRRTQIILIEVEVANYLLVKSKYTHAWVVI